MKKNNALLVAAMLVAATTTHAETWPQPEEAYSSVQPRPQWLETTPSAPVPQGPPAYNAPWQTPWYGAPGYYTWPDRGIRPFPWQGPVRSWNHRNGWPGSNWIPGWNGHGWPSSFSMPSPSFSLPAEPFFGW